MQICLTEEQYVLEVQESNLHVVHVKTGGRYTYLNQAIPHNQEEAIFLVESCLCFLEKN